MDIEDSEYEDYLIGSYVPLADLGVQTLKSMAKGMNLISQGDISIPQKSHVLNGQPVLVEFPMQALNPHVEEEGGAETTIGQCDPIKLTNLVTLQAHQINLDTCPPIGQFEVRDLSGAQNELYVFHRRSLKESLYESNCPSFEFKLFAINGKTKQASLLLTFQADDFKPIAKSPDSVYGIVDTIHRGTQKRTKTLWVFPQQKPLFQVDPISAYFVGGKWLYEWSPSTVGHGEKPITIKRRHLTAGTVKGEVAGLCKCADLHTIDCFGDGVLLFIRKVDQNDNTHFEVIALSKTLDHVIKQGSMLHHGNLLRSTKVFRARIMNLRFACFLTILDGVLCLNTVTVYKTQSYSSLTRLFANKQGLTDGTILGICSPRSASKYLHLWVHLFKRSGRPDMVTLTQDYMLKF